MVNKNNIVQKLISSPSMQFKSVNELLNSSLLNQNEKYEALKNWKLHCNQIILSTSEGMHINKNEDEDDSSLIDSEIDTALRDFHSQGSIVYYL